VEKVYNVILFTNDINTGNNGFVKYRKIDNLERFKKFIDTQYPKWVFATLYDNKTKEKIGVIKKST